MHRFRSLRGLVLLVSLLAAFAVACASSSSSAPAGGSTPSTAAAYPMTINAANGKVTLDTSVPGFAVIRNRIAISSPSTSGGSTLAAAAGKPPSRPERARRTVHHWSSVSTRRVAVSDTSGFRLRESL